MDPEIGKCISAEDNSLENWSSMPKESSAWKRWCDKHGNLLEVKKMPTSRSQKRDAAAEAGTEKGNAGWKHRFAVEISGRHGLALSAESRERTPFRRTAISLVGAERRLARNDVVDVVIPQRKFSAGLIESSDSYPSTHPSHGLLLSSPLHLFPLSVTGAASFVTRVLPPNSTVHRYFWRQWGRDKRRIGSYRGSSSVAVSFFLFFVLLVFSFSFLQRGSSACFFWQQLLLRAVATTRFGLEAFRDVLRFPGDGALLFR